MTIQEFIILALFLIGAAFLIHKTGRQSGRLYTVAGYVVAAVGAVVAALGDKLTGLW